MAGAKEIRGKIKSVKNTQKITRAMEKVAMSKMRRAQDRMAQARPYAQQIRKTLSHLAAANTEITHPFLVKRVAFLVVSTDRGLCGGLNINTFRATVRAIQEWKGQGVEAQFAVVGAKGVSFFKRVGGKVQAQVTQLGDKPQLDALLGTIKTLTDAYLSGEVDRVELVSSEFVNTMTQRPRIQPLLPVAKPESNDSGLLDSWDYLYEPSAESLMDLVLTRYLESQVYQAVIENVACEMAARMVAMKSATDNAGKIITDLQLAYNKARQANITKELAEIVGGAAAV
jgi:F-type H+-transporting ATPase subunit gamma